MPSEWRYLVKLRYGFIDSSDEVNSQLYWMQFLNPGGSVKDRVALRSEFQENSGQYVGLTYVVFNSDRGCRTSRAVASIHRLQNI
jgi:hypothetical protein